MRILDDVRITQHQKEYNPKDRLYSINVVSDFQTKMLGFSGRFRLCERIVVRQKGLSVANGLDEVPSQPDE